MTTYLAEREPVADPDAVVPPRPLRLTAVALSVWSGLYVLPHVYWALGGEHGFSLLRPEAVALDEWRGINAVASLVLLLPIGIGLGLLRHRRSSPIRVALLGSALAGTSIATAHGIYGIVYRILNLTGVVEVDGEKATVSEHPWVLWDLLLFEPWFLIEGILFFAVGWTAIADAAMRRRWALACGVGIGLATLSGVLGLRFA
jgi:hypothetical protein